MGPFDILSISASALSAERQRSEVIAANMANAETTHTDGGGPFTRKEVVFSSASNASFHLAFASAGHTTGKTLGSVRISQIVEDKTPPVMRYEPGHPDADKDGYVAYPAINPVQEMVDLMGSTRAYQLNASAVTAAKQMIQQSIDILKS
ncbi:flagellar basal body rod protein FlgC [Granulicella sibirica]|uniref:Flagellar basal-body rod protein FlgC n=1 Tax=Granulicella sibirica TaxID=2479048 RepID=A0A4Q0T6L3_9BACT|nr:flagellar basal body rod protein FlgC [Granulicella sibirica]RXH57276.1 Flagellar basal-body rod protein FlgC [Granulicella sibirica]